MLASVNTIGMQNGQKAVHGDDNKLFVTFYIDKILLTEQTEAQGEPVYREAEMIRINVPGDAKTVVIREVTREDQRRFPNQWDDFKAGREQLQHGHALSDMGLGKTEVDKLNYMNVVTVEQLADLPDHLLEDLGLGARGLRDGAAKWLESRKVSVDEFEALKKENTTLSSSLKEMQDTVALMREEMAKLSAKK
jgi:uncharacterized protein YjiS (DUF1127 family)